MDIYRVALDSIPAHVAILDETGLILKTNRALEGFRHGQWYPYRAIMYWPELSGEL